MLATQCIKKHSVIYFKTVNFRVYELYINKVCFLKVKPNILKKELFSQPEIKVQLTVKQYINLNSLYNGK